MTQQQLWDDAYAAWAEAMGEARVYERDVWYPAYEAGALSDRINSEGDRLSDARSDAEDRLLPIPALNASQLATKLLICFDNGRGADWMMPVILNDCRRFADDSLTKGDFSPDLGAQPLLSGGHRGWMQEYVAAIEEMAADASDEKEAVQRLRPLAQMILNTPAATDDDVIVKMALAVMEAASGASVVTDPARAILREAIEHFGLGTTADFEGVAQVEDKAA